MDDVHAEHERLAGKGVRFTQPPSDMGSVVTAVFSSRGAAPAPARTGTLL